MVAQNNSDVPPFDVGARGGGHLRIADAVRRSAAARGPDVARAGGGRPPTSPHLSRGRTPPSRPRTRSSAAGPPVARLALAGVGLGLAQGVLTVCAPLFPPGPPSGLNALPSYALFFAAGAVAQRNAWLDEPLPAASRRVARALAAAAGGAVVAWAAAQHRLGGPGALQNACGTPVRRGSLAEAGRRERGLYVAMATCLGLFAVTASVCALEACQRAPAVRSAFLEYLAAGAYAVYLLHPLVVTPLTWGYAEALRLVSVADIVFPDGGFVSTSCTDPHSLALWLGCLVVPGLGLAVVFPLAFHVRRLPGLNRCL